ncbi:hypothetical protein [Mesorhizobium sp. M0771]|uniref:hypothetical protein n=1 Tax=Mesorhizobium sp. M0771 TaxID=2956997 RepID=UPI00333740E3
MNLALRLPMHLLSAGGVNGPVPLAFPAANAVHDLDFAGFQYFGGAQPETNSSSVDGRFFRGYVTGVSPSFYEETDGSLRTFTTTSACRRTSRGLAINHDHTNIVVAPRDLTNVAWVKGSGVTAAKNQTGRTKVANSASLLTFTADGTCLQAISSTSVARRMYVDIKQITGTDPLELTMDGTTFTAKTINAPRYNGIGRYSLPAQTLATYSVGFRGKAGNSYLIDFANVDESEYEQDPVSTNARAWRDRAAAYVVDGSPLAIFADNETTQVYFFEYAQRRDGALIASDGDLQISSNAAGVYALGLGPTVNKPGFSDERLLVLNRVMAWRSPTASGLCLNGGPVVTGPGFTPDGSLTHWDLGTNGAANLRIDGRITRFFTSRTIPSVAQARLWTTLP